MKRKPKPYGVTLLFQDRNAPRMRQAEPTEALAWATARHWLHQFAGVRAVIVEDGPGQARHVVAGNGEYLFTVPIV